MTTTTYTASVNGVVLNQDAFNFPTREGRLNGPSIRGADVELVGGADRPTSHWYGPKAESWNMWVSGFEYDEGTDSTSIVDTGIDGFTRNLNYLKRLFLGNPSVPLELAKVDPQYGPLSAKGRCTDVSVGDVISASGFAKRVQFDIVIPDGVWRMPSASFAISSGTFDLPGNAMVEPDLLDFSGASTVDSTTTATGFAYTGGASLIEFPAMISTPVAALSSFFPKSVRPLRLVGGQNTFNVTGASVTATYRPGVI
jgi:hypothetical protein